GRDPCRERSTPPPRRGLDRADLHRLLQHCEHLSEPGTGRRSAAQRRDVRVVGLPLRSARAARCPFCPSLQGTLYALCPFCEVLVARICPSAPSRTARRADPRRGRRVGRGAGTGPPAQAEPLTPPPAASGAPPPPPRSSARPRCRWSAARPSPRPPGPRPAAGGPRRRGG